MLARADMAVLDRAARQGRFAEAGWLFPAFPLGMEGARSTSPG